ncbi:UNVERIFIED_CONTAM: hypothetical protein FKN15_021576 [Acipenser sinensis]
MVPKMRAVCATMFPSAPLDSPTAECDVRSLLSQPGPDGAPSPSLLLAAVAPDSTLAYYRFSRGFVVPEPPDSIQALECGRERRKRRRL